MPYGPRATASRARLDISAHRSASRDRRASRSANVEVLYAAVAEVLVEYGRRLEALLAETEPSTDVPGEATTEASIPARSNKAEALALARARALAALETTP